VVDLPVIPGLRIIGHVKIIHMSKKDRVDQILVNRGLAADLDQARRLVMAGKVLWNDQVIVQPSQSISTPERLSVLASPPFVSRGGDKLQGALTRFSISLDQKICADIGSSTGGFTDCLLQHGAKKVYAIDVGYGLLDWRLRNDPRVIVMERTNARSLTSLPDSVDFITADVSFISLKKILPAAAQLFGPKGGESVILIKPQFEATRQESATGAGVITDPEIHQRVLQEILEFAGKNDFQIKDLVFSSLMGPEGNSEFLAWLGYPSSDDQTEIIQKLITELF
jgi:23S rRNA (cytidine1920-2'-O)/16S rRNA (cytidine1409-2'-O)-methyltransferase